MHRVSERPGAGRCRSPLTGRLTRALGPLAWAAFCCLAAATPAVATTAGETPVSAATTASDSSRSKVVAPVLSEPVLAAADSIVDSGPATPVSFAALADTLTPRGALLRSAILPGWGQLRNGKHAKAALFAGAAGGFLTAAILDVRAVRRAPLPEAADGADEKLAKERAKEKLVARRNTRFLYFFIAATLSALDAFVDTHLADFGDEPMIPGSGLPAPRIRWTYSF